MIVVVLQACFVESPWGCVRGSSTWPPQAWPQAGELGWELVDGLIVRTFVLTGYKCKSPKISPSLRSNGPRGNRKTHVWVWRGGVGQGLFGFHCHLLRAPSTGPRARLLQ